MHGKYSETEEGKRSLTELKALEGEITAAFEDLDVISNSVASLEREEAQPLILVELRNRQAEMRTKYNDLLKREIALTEQIKKALTAYMNKKTETDSAVAPSR